MDTTEAEAYVEAMLSFTNAKRALSGTASSAKALTRNQMVEAMADVLPSQSAGAEAIERYAECMGGLAKIICEMRSYPERVRKELETACKRAETAEEILSKSCDNTIKNLRGEQDKAQALKPLEEAAEVFGAWQAWQENGPTMDNTEAGLIDRIIDECADVIQATLNLVAALGVEDFRPWMKECERRNRERGRISDGD